MRTSDGTSSRLTASDQWRHVHRHVFDELLKFFAARDEIAFAIYFDHHADSAAHEYEPTTSPLRGFLPAVAILFLRRISTVVLRRRRLRCCLQSITLR